MRITEGKLRSLIRESIMNVLNEDMRTHTYDSFLDDDDFIAVAANVQKRFISMGVSIEDFMDEECRERLLFEIEESVYDFLNYEACDDFSYKYGDISYGGMLNLREHILDFLEEKFREK